MRLLSAAAALALTCALMSGCDLLSNLTNSATTPTTPTSTTPTTTVDAFAGTWASVTASTPPTGCGNATYTVTPISATSANVNFTATCAGNITVTGSGSGTLSGSTIGWGATGLVSQGGVNCPFTFTNGTATMNATSQMVINYSGTVCGIPVSGTETVKK